MSQFTMLRSSAHNTRPESFAATLTAVTFLIGTQEYGVPVPGVFAIVPIPAILTVPGAPAYLAGLLNLYGRYLPVLDGRILVGEPIRYDLDQYIIIAGHARAHMQPVVPFLGLLVDQVCEVRIFETDSLTPLSSTMAAPFLRGVARWADRSVLLFSLEQLLALAPSISMEVASS